MQCVAGNTTSPLLYRQLVNWNILCIRLHGETNCSSGTRRSGVREQVVEPTIDAAVLARRLKH